ncbi:OmpA/MotB domain protein [Leadbetterella byssophila DSM 17132]|uniref:OmpA/MotB domain protein n=2 Tax=Leadbetterella TaxID=319458 RepID=E4RTA5_LEAB4|nr:OmpA/MotB domain protein [Leadbetterella byssophila DSM 17132]
MYIEKSNLYLPNHINSFNIYPNHNMDLLQFAKDQLNTTAITRISDYLDQDPVDVTAGLSAALPTLIAGFMQKASTTQGAGYLLNLLKNDSRSEEFSFDIAGALDSGKAAGLVPVGSGILSSLFGDKVKAVTEAISNASGMREGTSSLLNLAAPLIMGILSRKVKNEGLGLSGLVSLLMGQKDSVKAALPAGLAGIINVNSLGDFIGDSSPVRETYSTAKEEVETESNSWMPWLILALILLGGIYFWKQCSSAPEEETLVVEQPTISSPDIEKTLPGGVKLSYTETSIENELINFIEDNSKAVDKETWFNFRKLTFEQGSALIDASSQKEVDNIAEILKAYPDVNIKIGGYTDNTGSDEINTKLSAERAANVLAALVDRGIEASRLESEGYGPLHPIADNSTEEGREQDRRIAVRVTKK